MAANPRVLGALSVATGLALGAAILVRTAPFDPFLDTRFVRLEGDGAAEAWDLTVAARGGEAAGDIGVAGVTEGISVEGPAKVAGIPRGGRAVFRLRVPPSASGAVRVVRVTQTGPMSRDLDLTVQESR